MMRQVGDSVVTYSTRVSAVSINVDWILHFWHHGIKIKLCNYVIRSTRHPSGSQRPGLMAADCQRVVWWAVSRNNTVLLLYRENPKIPQWYRGKWSYCDITTPTNQCMWYHITLPSGHLVLVGCIEQFYEIRVAGFINLRRRYILMLVSLVP